MYILLYSWNFSLYYDQKISLYKYLVLYNYTIMYIMYTVLYYV